MNPSKRGVKRLARAAKKTARPRSTAPGARPISRRRVLTVIAIALAVVVTSSVAFTLVRTRQTCAHTITGALVVHVDEKGFDPATLNVSTGQKIIFENSGFSDAWPAADMHPTHETLPSFDPRRPIVAGETWEFTFSDPGEYTFHDHLMPAHMGKATVTGPSQGGCTETAEPKAADNKSGQPLETAFTPPVEPLTDATGLMEKLRAACNEYDHPCTEKFMGEIVAKHGPRPALLLYTAATQNSFVSQEGDGHQVAHRVGRKTAQDYGVSFSAFDLCDTAYNYGCQHGYFEYVLGRTETSKEAIDLICGAIGGDKPMKAGFYCYHGAGHGVMMAEANDVDKSLGICDELAEGDPQVGCWQGVLMENVNAGLRGEARKDVFSTKNLLQPCDWLDKKYRQQCYENQAGWIATYAGSVEKSTEACLKADPGDRRFCMVGVGIMATDPSRQAQLLGSAYTGDTVTSAWEYCRRFPDGHIETCVEASVLNLANFDELNGERMHRLCQLVEDSYRGGCYRAMHSGLYNNSRHVQDVINSCAIVNNEWRNTCEKG